MGNKTDISAKDNSVAVGGDIKDSVVTINQRDPDDKAIINALISQNELLVEQVKGLKEQIEPAVVGLSNIGENTNEIEQAREALALGNTNKAIALYQQAALRTVSAGRKHFVQAAEYYVNLGALATLSNTSEALSAYKQAVELDPLNPDAWNQLGVLHLINSDFIAAEKAFEKLRLLSEDIDNKWFAATAIGNLGIVDEELGRNSMAEDKFLRSLKISQEIGDLNGMASSYGSLIVLNTRCGNNPQALRLIHEARRLFKKTNNQHGLANVDVSEATILVSTREDFEKAEELYMRALQNFKSSSRTYNEASQHANLGNLYELWKKHPEQILEHYRTALQLFESLENQAGKALAYVGIGRAYLAMEQLEKAALNTQQSLDLYRDTEDQIGLADTLTVFGFIKLRQGCDKNAEIHIDQALSIYQSFADKEKIASGLVLKGHVSAYRRECGEQRRFYIEARDLYSDIGSPIAQEIQRWIDDLDANLGG